MQETFQARQQQGHIEKGPNSQHFHYLQDPPWKNPPEAGSTVRVSSSTDPITCRACWNTWGGQSSASLCLSQQHVLLLNLRPKSKRCALVSELIPGKEMKAGESIKHTETLICCLQPHGSFPILAWPQCHKLYEKCGVTHSAGVQAKSAPWKTRRPTWRMSSQLRRGTMLDLCPQLAAGEDAILQEKRLARECNWIDVQGSASNWAGGSTRAQTCSSSQL
eukprot:1151094-Pelagomonas_calceolata.AAC.3